MPASTLTTALFARTALLMVLLALPGAACGQTGQESGNDGGEPGPIDAGGGKTVSTAGSGEASARRVEISSVSAP